jgi:hypothetical protein
MTSPRLPDPREAAKALAERVRADHQQLIEGPVDRVMADAPWADREVLFSGLVAYQKERLTRIPPAAKYPEAGPRVEQVLAVDRELHAQGLSDWEIAVIGGINDYLAFRGYRLAGQHPRKPEEPGPARRPRLGEKCRVAYLPESDRGAVHAKNVDDPATFWRKSGSSGTTTRWRTRRRCRGATAHAPWYVIPAEHHWYRNLVVMSVMVQTLESLKMQYPKVTFDPKKIVVK